MHPDFAEKGTISMTADLIRRYSLLVEFLGRILGPDYEIVLHDLSRKQPSVIAIANGQISGRTIGAPLTNVAMIQPMNASD